MKGMGQVELLSLSERLVKGVEEAKWMLLPHDVADDRDAILEVRAGTGGDEAALFAGDLMRMYLKHAEERGWKHEWVNASEGTVGGFKEAVVRLEGDGVFGWLKFERGVHRVQRVPETESQGRVHTSAATVAVLPLAREVDVELQMSDVRKDTFRASGAGGQHVNKPKAPSDSHTFQQELWWSVKMADRNIKILNGRWKCCVPDSLTQRERQLRPSAPQSENHKSVRAIAVPKFEPTISLRAV